MEQLMDRQTAIELPDPADWDDDRDQVVVLHGVSWDHYETLLRARGESNRPLIAYLDGELELVTTSSYHEVVKVKLRRLLEAYAEERHVSLNGFGEATRKRRKKQSGVEPDEWYKIGTRGGWAPDLAIEVVYTSGGVDKLEIYRRFAVGEVWFWIDDRVHVFRLVEGRYQRRTKSVAVPGIDLDELAGLVLSSDDYAQTEMVRTYRRSLQKRRRRATGRAASRRRR
jgi:Uma2 family endonuclease